MRSSYTDITYSCGHTEATRISFNSGSERDSRAEYLAQDICEGCKQEERSKQATERAQANDRKYNLPELTGSEKQINWATKIRNQLIEMVEELDADQINVDKRNEVMSNAQARYWIDNRNDDRYNHRGLYNLIGYMTADAVAERIRQLEDTKVIPALIGTPEDVEEGNRIRSYSFAQTEDTPIIKWALKHQSDATWWIDNEDNLGLASYLAQREMK